MSSETDTCTIRLEGRLDDHVLPWLEGFTVTAEGATTVISGPVVDQAALLGLLQQLRDLGLPLISVARGTHPR